MTTLTALINLVEADLSDSGNTTWSAADIEQWLRDAIADYSLHFPRKLNQAITTSAGDKTYDLTNGFQAPYSVEYPTGESPPQYLTRRPYTHPNFWSEDGYYDIIHRLDDTDQDEIWISNSPTDSQTITVIYLGRHDQTVAVGTNISVPARHHHILRAYARWKATQQRVAAEEASPTSSSSLLMSQLKENTRRWKLEYLNELAKAIQAAQGHSQIVSWADRTQESIRIY